MASITIDYGHKDSQGREVSELLAVYNKLKDMSNAGFALFVATNMIGKVRSAVANWADFDQQLDELIQDIHADLKTARVDWKQRTDEFRKRKETQSSNVDKAIQDRGYQPSSVQREVPDFNLTGLMDRVTHIQSKAAEDRSDEEQQFLDMIDKTFTAKAPARSRRSQRTVDNHSV